MAGPKMLEHRRSNSRTKVLFRYVIILSLTAWVGTTVFIHTVFLKWVQPIFSPNFNLTEQLIHSIETSPLPIIPINTFSTNRRVINISSCHQTEVSHVYYYLYLNSTEEQQPATPIPASHSLPLKQNTTSDHRLNRILRHRLHKDGSVERSIDPNRIQIEDGYDGIHPTPLGFIHTHDYGSFDNNRTSEEVEEFLFQSGNLPMDFVMAAIHAFARLQTNKIHKRYVARVLLNSKNYMDSLPSLLRVSLHTEENSTSKERITVVGDIHGDLYAMLHIFDTNGFPSLSHRYIFNGDVLDKGYRSMETLVSLLMIQLSCPQCIYITRGNHEDISFLRSRVKSELQHLYGSNFFQLLLDVVNALPLASLVNDEIFVVHGGIVNPSLTLEEISSYPRGVEVTLSDSLITDLLWSDPSDDHLGVQTNMKRWHTYGQDIVDSFLKLNNLSLLIRSHQVAVGGTRVHHDGKTITIYSAPLPNTSMKGAYMNIGASSQVDCRWFNAAPYPKIAWSKYGFKRQKRNG